MFKRKIFYLGGFDPRGARFYHQLLSEQIASYDAALAAGGDRGSEGGEGRLTLSPRRRAGSDVAWAVTDDAGAMRADTLFLMWDDLVRRHWPRGPLALLWHCLVAYRHMLARLDWRLAMQWPPGSRFTLFYPGATFVGIPLLLAVASWLGLRLVLPWWAAAVLATGAAGLIALVLLRWMHSLWLLRFVIFNDQLARGRADAELERRLDHFAEIVDAGIDAALAEGADEVLLLTHSNGSILAVPLMARLLARRGGVMPARFALVTLGCCMQLLAARRDAGWFAAQLDTLAAGQFAWVDIGSVTDGACAPMVDPCQGRPISRPPGLVQLSPRWFRYCDPATYAARRKDKYLTHFDYLRRLDRPSPLDYLGLTCAARPLAASVAAFRAENIQAENIQAKNNG